MRYEYLISRGWGDVVVRIDDVIDARERKFLLKILEEISRLGYQVRIQTK